MNDAPTTLAPRPAHSGDRTYEPGLVLRVLPIGEEPIQAHIGMANLELAQPITANTTFNVGSVAKQITAYLCVRSVSDAALDLGSPLSDILPRFRVPDVTVGELIQHHGGIRDAESLLALVGFRDLDHYTADDLLELAYRQRRRAVEPGRFLYSNTGYLILREVLEHIHGARLQDIADEQIFTPLGMASARFKSDPREVIPGAASSYQPAPGSWLHDQCPVALPGPGSLWCTVADLDRWLDHLENEWQATAETAFPFDQHVGYKASDHQPFTYGPGLYADPRAGRTAVFHHGHEQGFSASAHLASSGLRVICLSNHGGIAADHIAATVLADLGTDPAADPGQVVARVLHHRPEPSHPPAKSPHPDAPHTTLGTYICEEVPGTVRLTRSEETLYLWRRGTRDRLTRTGATTYTAHGYTLTLRSDGAGTGESAPGGFVLDLDRAPGLHYRRHRD